jgi:hypothetical protein
MARIAWRVSHGAYRMARIAWRVSHGAYRMARCVVRVALCAVSAMTYHQKSGQKPAMK